MEMGLTKWNGNVYHRKMGEGGLGEKWLGNRPSQNMGGSGPVMHPGLPQFRRAYAEGDELTPGQFYAARAEPDRRDHARTPGQYAELFDTGVDTLFRGRVLNIGDPQLAVDLPGVVAVDVHFLTTRAEHTHPVLAVYPIDIPFPANTFDRVIDYNGVTRTSLGAIDRDFRYEPAIQTYRTEVAEIILEAVRVLKEGGEGYFGSLYWLRDRHGEHGLKFQYFKQTLEYLREQGLVEYEIVDEPDEDEELNTEGYPKVSYLKIKKLRDLDEDLDDFLKRVWDLELEPG